MQRSPPRSSPPENYDRKLDTVENGRNVEADVTEKSSEKAEEEQDIYLHIDSKKKGTIIYPLKVVKMIILIESNDK